jgi:hypothetical protein
MKRMIAIAVLALAATSAFAYQCVTHTYYVNGKYVVCTTCCTSGQFPSCNTTCM